MHYIIYVNIVEKREKNRLKNIKWRKKYPKGYFAEAMRKYRKKHHEKIKSERLMLRYGITLKEYYDLLKKQNSVCAICGNEETAISNMTNKPQRLAVDHCHKTGEIRGLLCQDCNRGIGKFHDDIPRILKAAEYLQQTKKEPLFGAAL